jgi:3',5'-cyclic AMP phosphodiesterase CpdA
MSKNRKHLIASLAAVLVLAAAFASGGFTQQVNDFHFSLIGDRTGGAEPQIFGRVWYEVDLLHPDLIVTVGDTIEGGNDTRAVQEWTDLRPVWKRYSHYPIYFTAGNHDIWSGESRRLYEQETGRPAFYSFNYQNMHITILDNTRTRDLSEEQLQFLEEDLKANAARQPKMVVFHKPFWIQDIRERGTDFPLHKIAKKHGVEYIVSGHGHEFVRIVRDGIAYMEVGSSGGNMRGKLRVGKGFRDGAFYHHVWAHVKGNKIHFTVKEIGGSMGQGRMFRAEDWDENGPRFDTGDPALTEKPST